MATKLDKMTAETVGAAQARGMKIEYVSTLDVLSRHELCTAKSYVRSITPASGAKHLAAHPLREGQQLMAERVAETVRRLGLAS